MANFTYSTIKPQRKSLIKSGQLSTLHTDVETFLNTFFPEVASGSQYQTLLVNSGANGFDLGNVLRADTAVNFTDTANLAQGDILYFDGTDVNRLGAGSAGEVLQSGGAGADPSWVSVSGAAATVQRSTSTTALSFVPANTFNVIDPSAGSIVHYLPDTIVSTMKPIVFAVDGVNSWADNNWTLNGNGNNIIVVNADGSTEAAATTIDITDNVSFKVWTNGTQYIMERGN